MNEILTLAENLTEKTFNTGELALNYAENFTDGGPMVLLHGATCRWQDLQSIIPQLAQHWHLYAVDLRGHGKSGRDANHYRFNDYVRDIEAFLDQQVGEPAVLVGHSLGALTALGVAAELPDKVKALVMIDPPLFVRDSAVDIMPDIHNWFQMVYDLTNGTQSYEEIVVRCRVAMPDEGEAEARGLADIIYRIAPEVVGVALRDQMIVGFDIARGLQRIACPTLVLQADWACGGAMRDDDAAFVLANRPDAVIVKFPGTTHQLVIEHPDIVVRETQKFLQQG